MPICHMRVTKAIYIIMLIRHLSNYGQNAGQNSNTNVSLVKLTKTKNVSLVIVEKNRN